MLSIGVVNFDHEKERIKADLFNELNWCRIQAMTCLEKTRFQYFRTLEEHARLWIDQALKTYDILEKFADADGITRSESFYRSDRGSY